MAIGGVASGGSSGSGGSNALGGLGSAQQNNFLTLLVAQLKNQNPLQPMNSQSMLTELVNMEMLSQLASLQQAVTQLSSTSALSQAAGLIGKSVTAQLSNGTTLTGVVTAASQGSGGTSLVVQGANVPLSSVVSVGG